MGNRLNKHALTLHDFFIKIFPDSYVCAMKDTEGQMAGCIPSQLSQTEDGLNELFEKRFFKLNQMGWGIHFTPNGVIIADEKNRKSNFKKANVWFIDIDIESTKQIHSEEDKERRFVLKDKILDFIDKQKVLPSMLVETRNGFHLYWFIEGEVSLEDWKIVQNGLYNTFKDIGGDKNCLNECTMLRVPFFKYHKRNEIGFIHLREYLSTFNYHTLEQMKLAFPVPQIIWLEVSPSHFNNPIIFTIGESNLDKVLNYPIKKALEQMSGTSMVHGDQISFVQTNTGKLNILINRQVTPNWIDVSANHVYSNNQAGFCNIIHYLKWYKHTPKHIIQYFKDNLL